VATPSPNRRSSPLSRRRVAAALIAFAAALVYVPALDGPFIYDDFEAIVENESIRSLTDPPSVWRPPDETPMAGRPLANLSLALSHAMGGLEPRTFRWLNLALHILVGLAIHRLTVVTLHSPALGPRWGAVAEEAALAAALLWTVHPLMSEVVLYLTLRTESLATLFYLVALLAAIRAWRRQGRTVWSALAMIACVAALASKEMAVTAPVMVVLWDWSFRDERPGDLFRERWKLYAALAACWTVTAALLATGPRGSSVGFSLSTGSWDYLLNQCLWIPRYLRLAFWPHPLILDYGFPAAVEPAEALPGALLVLAIAGLTAIGLVRRRPIAFVGAWYLLLLAPSSSFVPIATEVAAERRVYLATAGVVVLAILAAAAFLRRLGIEPSASRGVLLDRAIWVPALALGAVAGLLAGLTAVRTADYASRVTIWTTVVDALPENFRGHNNRGLALADERRMEEAERSFRAALALREAYPDAQSNLCNVLRERGDLQQALVHCRRALELDPELAEAHNNLGATLGELGALDEAAEHFRRALEIDAGYAAAARNLERARQ
jgi:hypothetical protein